MAESERKRNERTGEENRGREAESSIIERDLGRC